MKTRQSVPKMAWSATHPFRPSPYALCVLVISLIFCGLGEAMIIKANLGAAPWTVLSLGVNHFTPFGLGLTTFCISLVVLLLWLPLRLNFGLGTLLNALVIAGSLGVFVPALPSFNNTVLQLIYCMLGIIVLGIATCFYLSCQMGGGPRDGLLVGIWQKVGKPIGLVRTVIELTVCTLGFLLGGKVGIGTLLFAFGVGQVMQICFKIMHHYTHKPNC